MSRKFISKCLTGKFLYPGIFVMGTIICTGIFETAFAVIGRPLTPYSYAGVARRTARRNAYYYDDYSMAPSTNTTNTSLPPTREKK